MTTAVQRGTITEALPLGVAPPCPAPPADPGRHVRRHVAERTRELTGRAVPVAHVGAASFTVPDARESRTARRWWSQRRFSVALLISVAVLGCGWRTSAVHWLSGHGPREPAVVVGGVLMALAGVCMVTLALIPGRRRQSTARAGLALGDRAADTITPVPVPVSASPSVSVRSARGDV
jgi:hypothetical protein